MFRWHNSPPGPVYDTVTKKNIKFEVLRNNKNLFLKEIQYKDVSFNEPNILKYLGILNFTNKSSTIGYVEDNTPAYFSGLISGDKIISINSMKIKNWNDIVRNIESNPDVNLNFHRFHNYILQMTIQFYFILSFQYL